MKDKWNLECRNCGDETSGTSFDLVEKGWNWNVAELKDGGFIISAVCPDCYEEGERLKSTEKLVEEANEGLKTDKEKTERNKLWRKNREETRLSAFTGGM